MLMGKLASISGPLFPEWELRLAAHPEQKRPRFRIEAAARAPDIGVADVRTLNTRELYYRSNKRRDLPIG